MKKKLTYFAAVALVLAACNSEEPIVPPMVKNDAMGANPYRVSLTDALKNADALFGELGEGETTRSAERKVESVEYYSRPGTRALGGDTLLYLVNYADDAGFALLSADSRLRPIYAISDEGSMSFSDTTYNKGLALFARGVEADVENAIASSPSISFPIDSLILMRRVVREVEPLLNYYQSRWNQTYPYNQYCFTDDGRPAYVGCTAVAAGMIMSYYKHPRTYAGYTFDWNAINSGQNDDDLARFLRSLGDENNLQMIYGAVVDGFGSISYNTRFFPTFENMGYGGYEEMQNFSEEEICTILDNHSSSQLNTMGPVLISGARMGASGMVGHSWVIDGYVQYEVTSPLIGQGYVPDDILYHCVWGWGGNCNGYFYWARDLSFGGRPEELGPDDQYSTGSVPVYDFSLSYMGGFQKAYQFNPNL